MTCLENNNYMEENQWKRRFSFYAIGNSVGIPYSIKKPCRAGSRSGGKVDVAYSDPPQAENPAKQDSFLNTRWKKMGERYWKIRENKIRKNRI